MINNRRVLYDAMGCTMIPRLYYPRRVGCLNDLCTTMGFDRVNYPNPLVDDVVHQRARLHISLHVLLDVGCDGSGVGFQAIVDSAAGVSSAVVKDVES